MDHGGASEIGVVRQLAMLNRIARIAVLDLELRPMLQRIVDVLYEELEWEFLACASVDLGSGTSLCEAVRCSLETDIVVGYSRPLGFGIVGECVQTARTADVDDIRAASGASDSLPGTRAQLCVPVIHNGVVLAVLNAESRQS